MMIAILRSAWSCVVALGFRCFALFAAVMMPAAYAEEQVLTIDPHVTDNRLAIGEPPHLVEFDSAKSEPLWIWLPGTNGRPVNGPKYLFEQVRKRGFRLIGLSYHDNEAVSQVCAAPRVHSQSDCATSFRQQRVWGDLPAAPIFDHPEGAIVPRLMALLRYLAHEKPDGKWDEYVDENEPRWSRIVLAGQSQGGGMAAFIAKTRTVAGVMMFSGGWDSDSRGQPARWYRWASATPTSRWLATYHEDEPLSNRIEKTYEALEIPLGQIYRLDLPVVGSNSHRQGITNPAYAPIWRHMLDATKP